MDFQKAKVSRLNAADFSRKGEIDHSIVELVTLINSNRSYFTTSSCSGRIIVFSENPEDRTESTCIKKGCQWLFISHDLVSSSQISSSLKDSCGNAVLKFEPFVLHVQCESTDKARIMHQQAMSAGFRNSGITIGNGGKIMAAVRSTHGLEVPLTRDGRLLVSEEYIDYLVELANGKMAENNSRIERFHQALKGLFKEDETNGNEALSSGKEKRKKKKRRDLNRVGNGNLKHKTTQTDEGCDRTGREEKGLIRTSPVVDVTQVCEDLHEFSGMTDLFGDET